MIYNSGSLTRFIKERPDVSQYYISEWDKFRKNLSKQTSETLIFESSDDWQNFVNRNKDKNIDPSVYMGEELKKAYSRLQNSPERLEGQLPKTFPGSHYGSMGLFSLSFSPFSFRRKAGIMENDPKYKRLKEAVRVKWLEKNLSNKENTDYFYGRLDGVKTKTLKEETETEFRQKYEKDAIKYDETKELIYKNPESDPVITLLNKKNADHSRAIYYEHQHSFATIDEKQKSFPDIYKDVEERGWEEFVAKHPEKAREYSLEKYKNYSKQILNAIERNRQREIVRQTPSQQAVEPIRPEIKTTEQTVPQKIEISHPFVGPINTAQEDTAGNLERVEKILQTYTPATTAKGVFGPKNPFEIFLKSRFFPRLTKLTNLFKRYAVNKKTLEPQPENTTTFNPVSGTITTILKEHERPGKLESAKSEAKARLEAMQARVDIQERVKENRLGILFRKLKSTIGQSSKKSADELSKKPQKPRIIRRFILPSFNPQIYQTEPRPENFSEDNGSDNNFGPQGNNETPQSSGNSGNHPGRHGRPNIPHRSKRPHIPRPKPKLLSTLKKARTALSLIQLLPIIIPIVIMILTLLFVVGFGGGGGFGGIGGEGTGGTPPPGGIIPGGGGLDYSIPFRDKSVMPKDIRSLILSSFPNAKIQNWDNIISRSISNGWNPAFVLTLWIEETGAQGASSYSDPLGCDPSKPTTDINISLKCLFDSFNSYPSNQFADFMCVYGGDGFHKAPCVFNVENPDFPNNIKRWYSQLVPDGPGVLVKVTPPPSSTGLSVSCPLSNPVITCGTYNTIVNNCGHGNTSVGYGPCDPSIYSQCPYNEQLKNAIDVDTKGGNSANAPVILPFINNQPVSWTKTSSPIPIAGGSWGYKVLYTTSYNGHNFSLDLTHINSNVNPKSVSSSGEQAGTVFPNLDGPGKQHLHTGLSFDGKWIDAISDAKLCTGN